MIELIRKLIEILNIISLIFVLIWGVSGLICEVIGPVRFEAVLHVISTSLTFEMFCKIGYVMMIVLIGTYFLKERI